MSWQSHEKVLLYISVRDVTWWKNLVYHSLMVEKQDREFSGSLAQFVVGSLWAARRFAAFVDERNHTSHILEECWARLSMLQPPQNQFCGATYVRREKSKGNVIYDAV